MKKRKPPVALATVLVVLLGVGALANIGTLGGNKEDEKQKPAVETPSDPTQGASRPATDSSTIAQNIKSAMGGQTTPPGQKTMAPGMLHATPVERSATPKPDPNGVSSFRGAK